MTHVHFPTPVARTLLALAACAAFASSLATAAPRLSIHPLRTPADTASGEPSLAVSPEGQVWLSWLEKRRAGGHAFRASRLEGERWTRPITIAEGDSFFVNWADFPTLLPLGGERLAAHWPWKSGADVYSYDVRIAMSRDGGKSWGPAVTPHRDGTASEHGFVSLLPAEEGARVAWLDGRDYAYRKAEMARDTAHGKGHGHGHGEGAGDMALRTAVVTPDGKLMDEAVLDPRVCDCCQTAAVRTAGGILVAYRDRSEDEIRDVSVVRWEGGAWSEPTPVHRDGWKIAGCPVNGPSMDSEGDRVAIGWFTSARDSDRVWFARSEDGGRSFGPPVRIDEGSPVGRVDVVWLEDGAAMVCWVEGGSGKAATIRLRRVGPDGATDRPITLATTASARASGFPRLVRVGDRLIFAWTDPVKPARVKTAFAPLK